MFRGTFAFNISQGFSRTENSDPSSCCGVCCCGHFCFVVPEEKTEDKIYSFALIWKTKSIHLVRATEGFSTSKLIGKGRYGSVYQGILFQDGHVVAIEVFSLETRGALRGFIAECKALRNVRHRNLVQLFTACSCVDSNGNDFKALVYEFMPQGDLHKLLYSTGDNEDSSYLNYISLAQRLSIVVDVQMHWHIHTIITERNNSTFFWIVIWWLMLETLDLQDSNLIPKDHILLTQTQPLQLQ
ncbi:hypothetical protein EJB05_57472, partial [Eragrostis curvula]